MQNGLKDLNIRPLENSNILALYKKNNQINEVNLLLKTNYKKFLETI